MPRITLNIEGRKTKKAGYLAPGRFSKEELKDVVVLPGFVVVITAKENIFIWEDAEEHASLKIDEAGHIISMQEEGVVMYRDGEIALYDKTATCLVRKTLSEEESKEVENALVKAGRL